MSSPGPGTTVLPGEPEWSERSLDLIRARYAAPLRPRAAASPRDRDDFAESMKPVALELASRLRSQFPEAIGAQLDRMSRPELYGLLAVALAMVDVDRPVEDLLAWLAPAAGPAELEPCGTEAAYRRHKRNGADWCEVCWPARALRKRAARAAEPPKRNVAA